MELMQNGVIVPPQPHKNFPLEEVNESATFLHTIIQKNAPLVLRLLPAHKH